MTRYGYRVFNRMDNPKPVFFVYTLPARGLTAAKQQVKLANGAPVHVNNQTWNKSAGECLWGLQIRICTDKILIEFIAIDFKCMSLKNAPTDRAAQVQKCLQRMQDGKCPYKLARQLFTGIKNK